MHCCRAGHRAKHTIADDPDIATDGRIIAPAVADTVPLTVHSEYRATGEDKSRAEEDDAPIRIEGGSVVARSRCADRPSSPAVPCRARRDTAHRRPHRLVDQEVRAHRPPLPPRRD